MIGSFFQPLRRRLLFLIALALAVPSAFGIWAAIDHYTEAMDQVRGSAESYAVLASNYENGLLRQAGQIADMLTGDAGVRIAASGGDSSGCHLALRQSIAPYPHFSGAALFSLAGTARCQWDDSLKLNNVQHRAWFQEVVAKGAPAISGLLMSPTIKEPVIAYAVPLFDAEKKLTGVVSLGIRLSWLEAAGQEQGLPPDSEVSLLDRDGALLVSSLPDPTRRTAALPDKSYFTGIHDGSLRRFEAPGADGIMRLYAAHALAGNNLFVLYSQPWQQVVGELRLDLFVQIAILALMTLAGLLTTAFAGRLLVTRWTEKLIAAAGSMKLGELSSDTAWRGAPREIHDLADTLQTMARKIEHREADLRDSLLQKQTMLREIHHREKNNLQIVTSLLSLYKRQMKGEPAVSTFSALQLRIKALALVHRYFYEHESLREITIAPFLTHLCTLLQDGSGVPMQRVRLTADLPDITISGDRAVPLALLTTELVMGALRHGFPENRSGQITLRAGLVAPHSCLFEIADNGLTGPRQGSADSADRLSATLVAAFARQLDATFSTDTGETTTHRLIFSLHAMPVHAGDSIVES